MKLSRFEPTAVCGCVFYSDWLFLMFLVLMSWTDFFRPDSLEAVHTLAQHTRFKKGTLGVAVGDHPDPIGRRAGVTGAPSSAVTRVLGVRLLRTEGQKKGVNWDMNVRW